MQVAQVPDLLSRLPLQTIVPLTTTSPPIFIVQVEHTNATHHNNNNCRGEIQAISLVVVRCIRWQVRPDTTQDISSLNVQINTQTYAMMDPIAPIPGIAAVATALIVSGAALSTPQVSN